MLDSSHLMKASVGEFSPSMRGEGPGNQPPWKENGPAETGKQDRSGPLELGQVFGACCSKTRSSGWPIDVNDNKKFEEDSHSREVQVGI